jgi:hypothetical protein
VAPDVTADGVDRLLVRAGLAVALLLVLAVLAGAARRALALPAVTPTIATGIVWLAGCAVVTIWIVLVVTGGYRDRWTGR